MTMIKILIKYEAKRLSNIFFTGPIKNVKNPHTYKPVNNANHVIPSEAPGKVIFKANKTNCKMIKNSML